MSEGARLERQCGDYVISDDPARFDADAMHDFLEVEGYWATGRSREQTAQGAAHSVVLGVYAPDGSMVGGARIVTDRATFGWLTDVYVLAEHRGQGLGRAVVAVACEHPAVADVKRLLLRTADAHDLYRSFGFTEPPSPERWMELQRAPDGTDATVSPDVASEAMRPSHTTLLVDRGRMRPGRAAGYPTRAPHRYRRSPPICWRSLPQRGR